MRRVMAALAVVALLAAAGCSGSGANSTSAQDSSAPVVLGTSAATSGTGTASATGGSGLAANSIPAALRDRPGGRAIALATGEPTISRADVLKRYSTPAGATLVSAVYVLLPAEFMRGVLNDPKKAKPTTAWVITYSGVTQRPHLPGIVAGKPPVAPGPGPVWSTEVADATTGEHLFLEEYPAPK